METVTNAPSSRTQTSQRRQKKGGAAPPYQVFIRAAPGYMVQKKGSGFALLPWIVEEICS